MKADLVKFSLQTLLSERTTAKEHATYQLVFRLSREAINDFVLIDELYIGIVTDKSAIVLDQFTGQMLFCYKQMSSI